MKCYYTGASPNNIKRAREHAPSHTHRYGWTPAKMTPHDTAYFLDNGAFTGDFDPDEWLPALERAVKGDMPQAPAFVVLPDVYGDAAATLARHRDALQRAVRALDPRRSGIDQRWAILQRDDLSRYAVLQPGVSVAEQFSQIGELPRAVDGVFVGGSKRWKRAHGREIVRTARNRELRVHVGRPGGADGLAWAYRVGADSVDTTNVFQNGYWHYLDRLERATEETDPPTVGRSGADQAELTGFQSALLR